MKKFTFFVLSVALFAGSVFAQDAAAIMQKVKDRNQVLTLSSRSTQYATLGFSPLSAS
jgi:hypothetical protein